MYDKNEPSTIQNMFNSIADRYDKTNACLSFNLHKRWNRKLVEALDTLNHSHHFLDLCCGTGTITQNYLSKVSKVNEAYLVDFSENMLECAKKKLSTPPFSNYHIHYIQADVQHLPLANNSIDRATMAYGIRNVKQPLDCLREVYRTLKPGGQLGILELTQPQHPILKFGHQLYLKTILPFVGRLVTRNQAAYEYLPSSIQSFISPIELEKMMTQVGFKQTKKISMTGGIATVLIGSKPLQ